MLIETQFERRQFMRDLLPQSRQVVLPLGDLLALSIDPCDEPIEGLLRGRAARTSRISADPDDVLRRASSVAENRRLVGQGQVEWRSVRRLFVAWGPVGGRFLGDDRPVLCLWISGVASLRRYIATALRFNGAASQRHGVSTVPTHSPTSIAG